MSAAADTSPAFFERMYRSAPDPWDFTHSAYETARYQQMLDALGERVFDSGYEPGCSIGAFTQRLAPRCRRLLACDASVTAASRARERVGHLPHVDVAQAILPADLPDQSFDLIVFSEIGYYFDELVLAQLIEALIARLRPGALLLGCHWLGHSDDHVLHGAQVHRVIDQCGLQQAMPRSVAGDGANSGYVLDVWSAERA